VLWSCVACTCRSCSRVSCRLSSRCMQALCLTSCRALRALRTARRHTATQANLAKIIEQNRTIQELRLENAQLQDWSSGCSCYEGEWLFGPQCIISGVSAMADALFAHWSQCQSTSADVHNASSLLVPSIEHVRQCCQASRSFCHPGLWVCD
jgi:hypothetical protein